MSTDNRPVTSSTMESSVLYWARTLSRSGRCELAPSIDRNRYSNPVTSSGSSLGYLADSVTIPLPPASAENPHTDMCSRVVVRGVQDSTHDSCIPSTISLPSVPCISSFPPQSQGLENDNIQASGTCTRGEMGGPDECRPSISPEPLVHPLVCEEDYTPHDVMPLFEAMLQGFLGPVVVDVHLIGGCSLVNHPAAFGRIIETHQHVSSGSQQVLLDSIKPFFLLRGISLCTLDTHRYPALPLLAMLLLSPKVKKVILHATLLYQLLFMYLGTDRVDIANVVHVEVWSEVMRHCSQPMNHFQIPSAVVDGLESIEKLLPVETVSQIDARAHNIARWAESMSMKAGNAVKGACDDTAGRTADLCGSSVSGGKGAIIHSVPLGAATGSSAGIVDDDVGEGMTGLCGAVGVRRPRGHAAHVCQHLEFDPVALPLVYSGMYRVHAFYERYLHAAESMGVAQAHSDLLVSHLCSLRTYVNYLCSVMSFHGVFIDKALLDSMLDNLEKQQRDLVQEGNLQIEAVLSATNRTADVSLPSVLSMTTISCDELVTLLSARHPHLRERMQERLAAPSKAGSSTRRHHGSSDAHVLHCAEVLQGEGEDDLLPRIWLALQERRLAHKQLTQMFSSSCRIYARIAGDPMGSDRCGQASASSAGSSRQPISYSIHPKWVVHGASTGRIFSSFPNVQNVPKHPPAPKHVLPACIEKAGHPMASAEACSDTSGSMFVGHPEWSMRQLLCAPAGCVLVSLDYNQIELRVLAHVSNDTRLIEQLSCGTDVLALMTRTVLQIRDEEEVSMHHRQAIKVIIYGLLYGMGQEVMNERLVQIHRCQFAQRASDRTRCSSYNDSPPASPLDASQVLAAFHRAYPRIKGFLRDVRYRALHEKSVTTVTGPRNLAGHLDGNQRKQCSVAVCIQGGAAEILHYAMRAVHQHRHELLPYFPAAPFALVMAVHDELVYAVPQAAASAIVPQIKSLMERQAQAIGLRVPLPVSARVGPSLGTLQE